jgi:hypothetical protein
MEPDFVFLSPCVTACASPYKPTSSRHPRRAVLSLGLGTTSRMCTVFQAIALSQRHQRPSACSCGQYFREKCVDVRQQPTICKLISFDFRFLSVFVNVAGWNRAVIQPNAWQESDSVTNPNERSLAPRAWNCAPDSAGSGSDCGVWVLKWSKLYDSWDKAVRDIQPQFSRTKRRGCTLLVPPDSRSSNAPGGSSKT